MSLATKDTSQPRKEVQSFANMLARAFRHWGHTPFYIFDLTTENRFILGDQNGIIQLTKNGDPQIVSPIVDDEGEAVEFDGNDDYFSVSNRPEFDVGQNESFSVYSIFQSSNVHTGGLVSYREGGGSYNGWDMSIRNSTNGNELSIVADDGADYSWAQATGLSTLFNGNSHIACGKLDRGIDETQVFYDGKFETNSGASSIDEVSASIDFEIGARRQNQDHFDGVMHTAAFAKDWSTEIQNTALHVWRQDRDNQPTIPTQLPNYITNAFGSSGPDFWWSADRHFRHKDGEGVEQLTDHAGSNFAVQRTASEQLIARGSTTRGNPLDSVESTTDNYALLHSAPTPVDDEITVLLAFYADDADVSDARNFVWGSGQGGTGLRLIELNSGGVEWRIDDGGGRVALGATYQTNPSDGDLIVVGVSHDLDAGNMAVAFTKTGGETNSDTNTGLSFGTIDGQSPEVIGDWNDTGSGNGLIGRIVEVQTDRGTWRTASELDTLTSDVFNAVK